jgi:hypothetical protein
MTRGGIAIIAALVVLVGGGVAGWLFWYRPREAQAASQREVKAWEDGWLVVRRCLVGERPLTADPVDALALADMLGRETGPQLDDCNRLIGRVGRPPGGTAGSDQVEALFVEAEELIGRLARAYADRMAGDGDLDARTIALGQAIAAIDDTHDRLRAAAGMPALARENRVEITPMAEPVALALGGEPLSVGLITAVDAGVIRGARFILTGPKLEQQGVIPLVDGIAAIPGGGWTVAISNDQIVAGNPPVPVTTPGTRLIPVAAIDRGTSRFVVAVPGSPVGEDLEEAEEGAVADAAVAPLHLFTSVDGGATWTPGTVALEIPGTVNEVVEDPMTGVVDVNLEGPGQRAVVRLDPPNVETVLVPWSADPSRACRAGKATWLHDDDTLIGIGLGAPVTATPPPYARIDDCSAEVALLRTGGGEEPVYFHRCKATECTLALEGSAHAWGQAALGPDGAVHYAIGRGGLLVQWTEGRSDARYMRMPEGTSLIELITWEGKVHALLDKGGVALVALLAP